MKKAVCAAVFVCLLFCLAACSANALFEIDIFDVFDKAHLGEGGEKIVNIVKTEEMAGAEGITEITEITGIIGITGTVKTAEKAEITEAAGRIDEDMQLSAGQPYTADTRVSEVAEDAVFGGHGRLIFPVESGYYSGDTLGTLRFTWYSRMNSQKTVEIANYLRERAAAGEVYFLDIYTGEEKAADPEKCDTGLFFFKGRPGEKFAVCNAGGGFAYVGAMQDSFPHALELSKLGYNAFALIYRRGAQTACEDLARAISFIFAHTEELEVDTDCYSLWGGSAGARMAAWVGSYGTAAFGGAALPPPGAVIMQYTGHSDYTKNDQPTFACVGKNDGIANWRVMENRLRQLSALGIPTEFHAYDGLGHGFGLGIGTEAEGWLKEAAVFWEGQMKKDE